MYGTFPLALFQRIVTCICGGYYRGRYGVDIGPVWAGTPFPLWCFFFLRLREQYPYKKIKLRIRSEELEPLLHTWSTIFCISPFVSASFGFFLFFSALGLLSRSALFIEGKSEREEKYNRGVRGQLYKQMSMWY